MVDWPNNADGDVFRSLREQGLDFSQEYDIDFNIDFSKIENCDQIVDIIKNKYPEANVAKYIADNDKYIQITIKRKIDYDFVVSFQNEMSILTKNLGGWCDSWGILH